VSVAFAAPWMMLGLLLLGLPIAAHLTGYREVRRVDFPTLRFLRASQLKVRRRTRLEALVLLVLRLLAIGLLVLLFCRPSLSWTATALAGLDPDATTLILVDVSASMDARLSGDRTVFDEAVEEAGKLLDGLADGTPAGLLAFGGSVRTLGLGITTERSRLRRELEELERGAGSTDLDGALRRAREVLRDAGAGAASIFVLTDGTTTAMPAGLDDWPEGYTVRYHDLLGRRVANRFPDDSRVRGGQRRGEGLRIDAAARAVGGVPEAPVPLTLTLEGGVEVVGDLEFGDDGRAERSFALPVPPEGQLKAALELPEDDLPIDDQLPFVLAGDSQLEVLLVSGDGGSNPREDEVWYLDKALQPGPGSPSRVRPRVVKAEELRRVSGGRGDVVFLCNVADPGALAPELEAFVRRGGGLFVSVGNRVDPDVWNDAMGALLPASFTEVKTRGRGTFEQAPMGLSLPPLDEEEFRAFRTGGAGVFARVGFGKVIGTAPRLAPDSEVLLRYTDALPALLERRVGKGRVVLFTSSIDDDWTDFPLRSIFVSIVHQFARGLSGTLLLDDAGSVEVGGAVSLPVPPDLVSAAWVVDPAGREHRLDSGAADVEGRVAFHATRLPGHYSLYWEDRDQPEGGRLRALFPVRVPALESELQPATSEALLRAVPGLIHHGPGSSVAADEPGEVVRTSALAPALLLVLALALLGEAVVAGRRA